jgi:hypothetical protein
VTLPPQAYLVAAGLAWNWQRSRVGKPTISMFCRRHRRATVAVVGGALGWFLPHIWHD